MYKRQVRSFTFALEAEKIHAELFKKAKEAAEQGKDFEVNKIYICPICGHTVTDELPNQCPVCGAKKGIYTVSYTHLDVYKRQALCCNPDYLLADEPTTALDVITQAEIINLLKRIVRQRNMGMLIVTHDLALATSIADKISVMHQSRIVEIASSEEIVNRPKHPHTIDLIRSLSMMEEEH